MPGIEKALSVEMIGKRALVVAASHGSGIQQETLRNAASRSKDTTNHGTSVAAVTPDHSVGDDSRGEIAMVFPNQIEGCRHRIRDVAGGTESGSDDMIIRLVKPGIGFLT